MCLRSYVLLFVILCSVGASPKKYVPNEKNSGRSVLDRVVKECMESKSTLSCFSDKAAIALERTINWDIPISDGINLVRNKETVKPRKAKSLTGFKRLAHAISDFVDTHIVSIDLTGPAARSLDDSLEAMGRSKGGGGGGGQGSIFNVNKKALKKEKKYYQYAFMVLLGIFGLTGPLVMKVLGVMAAQALLASKAALIIVGGVALRKLFEKDDNKPKVKVHTIPLHDNEEHEYERIGNAYNYNYIPQRAYNPYTSTGSHPYSAYSENDDFAPIFYGTQKKSR